MYCYPVRLAVPSPPLPSAEMHVESSLVCVRYKGEVQKVSRSYFSKLVRLFWGWEGGGWWGTWRREGDPLPFGCPHRAPPPLSFAVAALSLQLHRRLRL